MINQEPISLGSRSPSQDVPSEVVGSASPPAITGSQKDLSKHFVTIDGVPAASVFPTCCWPLLALPLESLLSKSPLLRLTLGLSCFCYLEFYLHVPKESTEPL